MSAQSILAQNPITLASASPRRRELLDQIHVYYEVCPVDIDESRRSNESPEVFVQRLAQEKAQAGFELHPERPALGSDTIVVFEQQIMGKPASRQQAAKMLQQLSGHTHQVMTAVALHCVDFQQVLINTSEVEFATLSQSEINDYCETGEADDKAGAYGIQGIAGQFIKQIKGSYSAIMGLPLYETAKLLRQAGITPTFDATEN